MKTLFNKFKASTRFDQEAKSGRNNRHGELLRFEKSLLEMDRELGASRSNTDLPMNLHFSIMRAVRASNSQDENSPKQSSRIECLTRSAAVSQTSRSRLEHAAAGFQHSRAPVHGEANIAGMFWPKLAGVSLAFVAIIGLLFWVTDHSSLKDKAAPFSPVIAASIASGLNEGHELTQVAPRAALEPLSGEMELLGRDIRNAVTFLVASMP